MTRSDACVDVTLLLEGTYPFVRGGVANWVHELIEGLPELSFSLVFFGGRRKDYAEPAYELPPNVLDLHCHSLTDIAEVQRPARCPAHRAFFSDNERLHEWFRNPVGEPEGCVLDHVLLGFGQEEGLKPQDFLYSPEAWTQISDRYSRYCPDTAFVSYFWAIRNTHGPLLKVARIARQIPPSKLFHAVSTGYAGLLGTLLQRQTRRPLVLTEHGIYLKERQIDVQSLFLREKESWLDNPPESGIEYHHDLWLRVFQGISRLAYASANPIISLYEQNRARQIRDGAERARTQVIPNGVDLERFAPLRSQRPAEVPLVLGLIGRVVPIKDVRTFIRAIGTLSLHMPGVQGWIVGPENEDEDYVRDCRDLVHSLRLEDSVRFLGFQNVETILPQLGLLVLSSISEAFPLVIGEAFASGLPVVATDVGACRELIEGRDEADRRLGGAGAVVPIFDPDALARAALALLSDPERWKAAQLAGIARVERNYRKRDVIERYRGIYEEAKEASWLALA
jgi:glycosyltransferase involved in cell wall biosynthesis